MARPTVGAAVAPSLLEDWARKSGKLVSTRPLMTHDSTSGPGF